MEDLEADHKTDFETLDLLAKHCKNVLEYSCIFRDFLKDEDAPLVLNKWPLKMILPRIKNYENALVRARHYEPAAIEQCREAVAEFMKKEKQCTTN